tara:strand:- start:458 stop:1174 length:717 start_codon:yes stop_codon:yes gene_type:complete
MTLPILETASFDLTLPSTDMKINFRPFIVKEEKILLQALESGESSQIIRALKDIVSACTFNQLDVDKLPTFDLEYIFLKIRSKSVGETAKIKVRCPDDNETFATADVDLSKVEVHVDDEHNNRIVIDEKKNIGVVMKYPTIDTIDPKMDPNTLKTEQLFNVITNSLHQIFEGEKSMAASDYSKEELNKFLEQLDTNAFNRIQQFFSSMPRLKHDVKVTNPKTKVESTVTLTGLNDFFG